MVRNEKIRKEILDGLAIMMEADKWMSSKKSRLEYGQVDVQWLVSNGKQYAKIMYSSTMAGGFLADIYHDFEEAINRDEKRMIQEIKDDFKKARRCYGFRPGCCRLCGRCCGCCP